MQVSHSTINPMMSKSQDGSYPMKMAQSDSENVGRKQPWVRTEDGQCARRAPTTPEYESRSRRKGLGQWRSQRIPSGIELTVGLTPA